MQLTEHTDAFAIRGLETRSFGLGTTLALNIAGAWHTGPLLLAPDGLNTNLAALGLTDVARLNASHVPALLRGQPAVVILATGARAIFPAAEVRVAFAQCGVGLEVMDTRAAAYTFNVLLQEQRSVLLLVLD